MRPTLTNCSTDLSPNPSISIAFRDAKWIMDCFCCAGQIRPPEQRMMASSSILISGELHSGHSVGILNFLIVLGLLSTSTLTISGITSPALRTLTVSPIWTSLRIISSSLWRVAFVTVTPPTKTGFNRATGVIAPVRPTWTLISKTSVNASSAGNLCAIAHRGARDTKPNSLW